MFLYGQATDHNTRAMEYSWISPQVLTIHLKALQQLLCRSSTSSRPVCLKSIHMLSCQNQAGLSIQRIDHAMLTRHWTRADNGRQPSAQVMTCRFPLRAKSKTTSRRAYAWHSRHHMSKGSSPKFISCSPWCGISPYNWLDFLGSRLDRWCKVAV